MPTIAELSILFTANDSGFRRTNTAVQKSLAKTSEAAEDTSTWIGLLERAIASLSDVEVITTGTTKALATEIKSLGKSAAALDKAMDPAKVAAYSKALGTLDGVGSALAVEFAELQKTVAGLNRTFGSQSPEGYGTKALASATSVDTLALSADNAKAQIALLNEQLAATRALVPRNINVNARSGGGGGGSISNSALGSAGMAVGRSLERNVTLPILAAGAASVYLETSFQAAMAKIEALSGISHDQVQKWSEEILNLGPKMGKMPIELAQGMFYVANEIKDSKQAMDVLEKAAGMSAEGMGKTEANAKALVYVLHDYADSNMTAAQAADTLVAATREGNFDVQALTTNLGKLLPIASAMDIPFNQIAGAIAAMTKEGATIPQATTGIQRLLLGIEKPSQGAKKALKAIGTSAEEVAANMKTDLYGALVKVAEAAHKHNVSLADILTTANGLKTGLSVLGKDVDAQRRVFDNVAKSAGSYQRALNVVNQTDLMTLNKSLASLESAGIKLGDNLAPEIYALAKYVGDLADGFRKLDPETQKSIVNVALLFAGIGPLIKAFGLLEKATVLAKGANVGMNLALWLTVPAGKAAAGGLEVAGDQAAIAQGKFAFLTTEINGARLAMAGFAVVAAAMIGWEIGTLAHNLMDEKAKGAGYDNTGDYLYGKLGGASDLFEATGPRHKTGDDVKTEADQPAPGFYDKWLKPDATRKRNATSQTAQALAQLRAQLDNDNRWDEAQRKKKAAESTAMVIGGEGASGGGKQSQAQKDAEQHTNHYRDSIQALTIALREVGVTEDWRKAIIARNIGEYKDLTATEWQHTYALISQKEHLEKLLEKKREQKALDDELAKGRAGLAASKALTDEDKVAQDKFGKPYASLSPEHQKWAMSMGNLNKDKQAQSVDVGAVQFDTGPDQTAVWNNKVKQLESELKRSQLADKVSKATSDEQVVSLEAGFKADWTKLPADIQKSVKAMADLRRNAQAAKVDLSEVKFDDGSEFAAKLKGTYLEALHTLSKEISDVGNQTHAVRVATLEWDDAGTQMGKRMSHADAERIAGLQEYLIKLKAAKAETDALAEKGASLLSGGAQHIFDHGFKGIGNYFKTESKNMVQGIIVDDIQKQSKKWLSGLLGGKEQDKNAALIAQIQANIAALNANTSALGGAASGGLGAGTGAIAGIPGVPAWTGNLGSAMSLIPAFANGGNYASGPMVVGENGPEIMIPSGSGRVIPNDQIGGETHYHTHNYGPVNAHFHSQDGQNWNPRTANQNMRVLAKAMKEGGHIK